MEPGAPSPSPQVGCSCGPRRLPTPSQGGVLSCGRAVGRAAGSPGHPAPCLGRTSQPPSPHCTPASLRAGTGCLPLSPMAHSGRGVAGGWQERLLLGALPRVSPSDKPLAGAPQSSSHDPAPLPRPSRLHLSLSLVFSLSREEESFHSPTPSGRSPELREETRVQPGPVRPLPASPS